MIKTLIDKKNHEEANYYQRDNHNQFHISCWLYKDLGQTGDLGRHCKQDRIQKKLGKNIYFLTLIGSSQVVYLKKENAMIHIVSKIQVWWGKIRIKRKIKTLTKLEINLS